MSRTFPDIINEWMRDDSDFDGKPGFGEIADEDIRAALVNIFLPGFDLTQLHPIAKEWANDLGHDADAERCACDSCTDKLIDYCQAIALVELVDDDN